MALNYDTRIEPIFPPALFRDPVCGPLLQSVGLELKSSDNNIMLFSDARTVAALNAADDAVKKVLRDAGFGFVRSGWNDKTRMTSLVERLREIAERYGGDRYVAKVAVFDLHRFVTRGLMADIEPNPFATPLPAVFEEFDLAAALRIMAPPQQAHSPKSPEHIVSARRRNVS